MIIRRNNSTTLTLESSSEKASVVLKNLDGQLIVKVVNGSKEVEITKPGDYEYLGIGITGFEIPVEKYTSVINLIKINIEGVRVVVTTQFREISKDILNNLANIDILAIPMINANNTKVLVNSIEPKKLVIIKSFGGEEVELDTVIKAVGIQKIEEVSSVKNKAGDFASTTDDFILTGEVLS